MSSFWDEFEDIAENINLKLSSDEVSFTSIVEDPNCLIVLRDQNEKLLEYFARPDVFREIFHSALPTNINPSVDDTDQYRLAHRCLEVLCQSNKKLNDAYIRDEETMMFLATFLNEHGESLNHLTAGFYSKVLLCLYAHDNEAVLAYLSKSHFIERALRLLKFSAISELLYSFLVTIPIEKRDIIKRYFIEQNFGTKMLEAFKETNDFIVLENTAVLWADFVKNMLEFCYSYEVVDDFLLLIRHPELVKQLIAHMFPEDKSLRSPAKIYSGCHVLLAFLERAFDIGQPSLDLNRTEERPRCFVPDAEHLTEGICASYIADLLETMLTSAQNGDGDVMFRCGMVIESIVNTSQTKNHAKFVEQLRKANFRMCFDFIKTNPSISILSSIIYNIVSYLLYCSYSEEDHIVSYIFNELEILSIIIEALDFLAESGTSVNYFAARSFFYRLAERVILAKDQSQNSARIMKHISELSYVNSWFNFEDNKLKEYLREHLGEEAVTTSSQSTSDLSNNFNTSGMDIDIGPNEFDSIYLQKSAENVTSSKSYLETFQARCSAIETDEHDDSMEVDVWPTSSGDPDEFDFFQKIQPLKASTPRPEDEEDEMDEEEFFRRLKPAASERDKINTEKQ